MRICGSDINPYLAFAASIASGMHGIKNKIKCDKPFDGNIYDANELNTVPSTMNESINLFKNSTFANDVFGEDIIEHYARFYELELNAYNEAVTDWERNRYFEMI